MEVLTSAPVGRPTVELPEEVICERIAEGESLASICRDLRIPRRTVFDRLQNDEDFRTKYGRAREAQAETFVDELIGIADSADKDTAAAVRVQVDTRRWVVSKILAKKYGEKPDTEVNVSTIVHNHIPVAKQKEMQARREAALRG